MALGAVESKTGGTMATASVVVLAGSGGTTAPVTATTGLVGAGMAVHGVFVMKNGAANLVSQNGRVNVEGGYSHEQSQQPLPRNQNGEPAPDPAATGPHTQLGRQEGRNGGYNQAREFDTQGKPVKDIDFTDHGRPNSHPNPHQHVYQPNPTGGTAQRGSAEPLTINRYIPWLPKKQ